MPFPPTERGRLPADLLATAERLSGQSVLEAQMCGGGANNRVYRLRTAVGSFALKSYGPESLGDRDRLGHEFDGLRFLKGQGIGSALPAALAVDREARCALYEWIEGEIPHRHGEDDIDAVLNLWSEIHALRGRPEGAALPYATEAVMRLRDLKDQIEGRLGRFRTAASGEPGLAGFLEQELEPEANRRLSVLGGFDLEKALVQESRTLSPSDFGFHNALRRPDSSLTFIDFEYFGWDDPVKLTADFLWHPAMELSNVEREKLLRGATKTYAADAAFSERLEACFPLYGIRWILIILNEFLPEVWARRAFSGKGTDWEAAKREQLCKARAKLAVLRLYTKGNLFS